jgi:hypothetical protein
MLPDNVYEALFDAALNLENGAVLEIGTAHGAATTAIGLGLLEKGSNNHVFTVDIFGGRYSSRSAFGSPSDNVEIVKSNLARAGIEKLVTVFEGSSDAFANSGRCPHSLSMLMLDADGRIDRDFLLFYELTKPGSLIVIDDADDSIFLSLNSSGEPYVDLKHRITHLLVDRFQDLGLISDLRMISNTLFCRSTGITLAREPFMDMVIEAYRELVFSAGGAGWNDLAVIAPRASEARRALGLYDKISNKIRPVRKVFRRLGF